MTDFVAPKVWLAPMSGATDAPMRRQALKFGAPAVVSEMTASDALIVDRPDVLRRITRHASTAPWIVQLAGRRPEDMRAAAQRLKDEGVDIVDINMGCPSRQVTTGLSGSALMREPNLAQEIIDATLQGASNLPVTLKMRLGWDHGSLNAPDLARGAEASGIRLITVHGRTRCQFYKGSADWSAISETVKAVDIPVIANGDIRDTDDAMTALEKSGAHGVMIGRAALGRPWLPGQIASALEGRAIKAPDLFERGECLIEQLEDSIALYGLRLGVRTFRKHISASVDHAAAEGLLREPAAQRRRLCTIEDPDDLKAAMRQVFLLKPDARRAA